MTTVYLPEIGFRSAGVRLAEPVHVSIGSRTLALTDLIVTPQGTDVAYYLTGLRGDEGDEPRKELVAVRSGDDNCVVTQGTFLLTGADRRVVPRRISSAKVIPPFTGPVDVSIGISGMGEFHLGAVLKPFGPETATPRRDLNQTVTHDGIAVTVGGFASTHEEIAVEIEAAALDGGCCAGIGAYAGHRGGPTALSLRDENGRAYTERLQEPDGRYDHKTLALFQPADPDARELELSIPFIYVVEEEVTSSAVSLPVTTAVAMQLGRYGIRVLATGRLPRDLAADSARSREPSLGVDVDLGGWHGDRRLLWPGSPVIDGDFCNLGFGTHPGIDMRRPEPATRIQVSGDRALVGNTLAFRRPLAQVRGPWTFRIPLL